MVDVMNADEINRMRLVPCVVQSNSINAVALNLSLVISPDSALHLGDNDLCEIQDSNLNENEVKIYIKNNNKVFAFCLREGRGDVLVNKRRLQRGERCSLQEGDILALVANGEPRY